MDSELRCPRCRSRYHLHRSRPRFMENLVLAKLSLQAFRCWGCGRRFYRAAAAEMSNSCPQVDGQVIHAPQQARWGDRNLWYACTLHVPKAALSAEARGEMCTRKRA